MELAIDKAQAIGDVRLAALARVTSGSGSARGRPGRGGPDGTRSRAAWHRDAGGGEQAALGECLLAAMDAETQVPDADERLRVILEEARRENDAAVEVLALDALARWAAGLGDTGTAREQSETADRRMDAAAHLITDLDRTDALWVRQSL